MINFSEKAVELKEYTRMLRRDFHRNPELGYQEVRTSGIVARELNELGLEVTAGIAGTGVMAILETGKPGPVVLLRFDMDALPINEETNVEYASQNPGVMHACGHDGHTAVGLTVARILSSSRDSLRGRVKFIFQPAEEGLGGAKKMVEEGVLDNPQPDVVMALHFWNEKPIGWFGIAPGPVMAAAEIFNIKIIGKGGHGAIPHLAIDPILAAAQVINSLQSIVSRNLAPLESGVISVTMIHGGDAFNVIPPAVEMSGTIRAMESHVRLRILEQFPKLVNAISMGLGCTAEINLQSITQTVVNDKLVCEHIQQISRELFPSFLIDTTHRTMGSEDVNCFMENIPGCFFFVGSANPSKGLVAPHHHPLFDIDEDALVHATALLATSAGRWLD